MPRLDSLSAAVGGDVLALVSLVLALVLLDLAALRWGVDSRTVVVLRDRLRPDLSPQDAAFRSAAPIGRGRG